jgi:shikimate dehydrogenase
MTVNDQYAVFGQPISHSKSPRIHQLFAQQTGQNLEYSAQQVSAENFAATAKHFFAQGGKGLNCTVPLKELAWQFADHLTDRARISKAVNTLVKQNDHTVLGDNTDGKGLIVDLTANHQIEITHSRILILGAGGASRGIIGPLLEQGPSQVVVANRTLYKAAILAEEFAKFGSVVSCDYPDLSIYQFDLIVNATSASLSDQLPPLPAKLLAKNGACYDLAYGNKPTAFVNWGIANSADKSLDGLGMLVEQAAEAFYLWRGVRPFTREIIKLLNKERETDNSLSPI